MEYLRIYTVRLLPRVSAVIDMMRGKGVPSRDAASKPASPSQGSVRDADPPERGLPTRTGPRYNAMGAHSFWYNALQNVSLRFEK